MATLVSAIETSVRLQLTETTASFWTSAELVGWIERGIKDLWRSIVDLKQEHYLTVDATNVSLAADSTTLTGVPSDVHKVYMIEPRDLTTSGSNAGLIFSPLDYNHDDFQLARSQSAIDPSNSVIYYAITGQGSPVNAPVIRTAPQVNSQVLLAFSYVPTLSPIVAGSVVPIPGEADNALIAWTIAWATAKEREDKSPDPNYLAVYATEKRNLMESLGLRQYQEPMIVDAVFKEYWS